jgi:hypothetical protein
MPMSFRSSSDFPHLSMRTNPLMPRPMVFPPLAETGAWRAKHERHSLLVKIGILLGAARRDKCTVVWKTNARIEVWSSQPLHQAGTCFPDEAMYFRQPSARSRQAGHEPQPWPQSCLIARSPR